MISEISDDSPLWRYMDLARYVALLDRGLFFARASSFPDAWEGCLGGVDIRRFRADREALSRDEISAEWKSYCDQKRNGLASVGISCWHGADRESAALWELYIPQGLGVAVRSTVSRVKAALAGADREIAVIRLTYTDYGELETGLEPLRLLSFKRSEFAHEKEVRFLVEFRPDEIMGMDRYSAALIQRRTRVVTAGLPRPAVISGGAFTSEDPTIERRLAPAGFHLQTDTAVLIDKVILAPSVSFPTRRAVIAVTEAFGLGRELIIESSVDMAPVDQLEFVDAPPQLGT